MLKKQKGIEEKFSFLLSNGFYLKDKFQVGELELIYSNNFFEILISYGQFLNDDLEQVWTIDVILRKEGYREGRNIVQCKDIFPNEKLQELKKTLINLSVNLQIELYAKFLEDNLNFLIPSK